MQPPPPTPPPASAQSATDKALAQLGLTRAIDLALHLPLRYEDEIRTITRLSVGWMNFRLCEGALVHCRQGHSHGGAPSYHVSYWGTSD